MHAQYANPVMNIAVNCEDAMRMAYPHGSGRDYDQAISLIDSQSFLTSFNAARIAEGFAALIAAASTIRSAVRSMKAASSLMVFSFCFAEIGRASCSESGVIK